MKLRLLKKNLTIKKIFLVTSCFIISSILVQPPVILQTQITLSTLNFGFVIGEEKENPVSFRIQLFKGKCLGSVTGSLVQAVFCDPTISQSFRFTLEGRLMFEHTKQCLQKSNTLLSGSGHLLDLGDCSGAPKFSLLNETYLQLTNHLTSDSAEVMCITPVTRGKASLAATSNPKQGDLVGLMTCLPDSSNVTLIQENIFLERRKALIQPSPLTNSTCNYPACILNKRAPPVQLLPPHQTTRCYNLSECVTVVTKTGRRPHLVARLAQSLRDVKGYDLPIIAVDDGGDPYSQEIQRNLSHFHNLNYIISDPDNGDLGIALGRTLAVQQVRTKYFLLIDDDTIITNLTNIELLAEILDTTDATLVGGKVTENSDFSGYLHFGYSDIEKRRELTLYKGACARFNETIENFPECLRCELTTNVFMAKTKDILEVGGWSEELKIVEHKDLFLRLKAAQKKVVYCPDFQIHNGKETKEERDVAYTRKRFGRFHFMKAWFNNIWNVDKTIEIFTKRMTKEVLSEIQSVT